MSCLQTSLLYQPKKGIIYTSIYTSVASIAPKRPKQSITKMSDESELYVMKLNGIRASTTPNKVKLRNITYCQ